MLLYPEITNQMQDPFKSSLDNAKTYLKQDFGDTSSLQIALIYSLYGGLYPESEFVEDFSQILATPEVILSHLVYKECIGNPT